MEDSSIRNDDCLLDKILAFIADKAFYPYIILFIIGVMSILFYDRYIGILIIGFSTIIFMIIYFFYSIYCIYRKKDIKVKYVPQPAIDENFTIDISKYFDNIQYQLYNDEEE